MLSRQCVIMRWGTAVFLVIVLTLVGSVPWTSAQTPESTLVPSQVTPEPDHLRLNIQAEPVPLRAGQPATLSMTAQIDSEPTCRGIPERPIDVLFVVDNSSSAGSGRAGSNLAATRDLLQGFITQSTQAIYPAPDYQNLIPVQSQFGLIATQVITSGPLVVSLQDITANDLAVREAIGTLSSGGDTELSEGIQLAVNQIQQYARPEANPVIVLALHDRLPINDTAVRAVEAARMAGIEVYLFSNSAQLPQNKQITTEIATQIVAVDHFWPDPATNQLRQAFIQMSSGNIQARAKDVVVTTTWLDDLLEVTRVDRGGAARQNVVTWRFDRLNIGESAQFTYDVTVSSLALPDKPLQARVEYAYINCDGEVVRSRPKQIAFPIAQNQSPTVTVVGTSSPIAASPTPESTKPTTSVTATPVITSGLPLFPDPSSNSPVQPPAAGSPSIPLAPLIGPLLQTLLPGISPILPWIVFILLLLLLLWILRKLTHMFRKKNTSPVMPTAAVPSEAPILQPVSDGTPLWIKRLTTERILAMPVHTQEKPNFHDTVIIGLGPAGREVLSQIAAVLHSRFGDDLPDKVHLLQVDTQLRLDTTEAVQPAGLKPEQWIQLRPDLEQVKRNLNERPEEWAHWQWYEATAPTYERARGRMALFLDLKDGSDNSVLWRGLQRALRGLERPVVRVIGTTFDDTSSGILIDVLRLVQLAQNQTSDVQLWLAGPVGQDWSAQLANRSRRIRVDEQKTRTLATMRELERFQRNLPAAFTYVPPSNLQDQFRAATSAAVVQSVFIFESDTASGSAAQHTAPENDVFACMADSLLALLHLSVYQPLTEFQRRGIAYATPKINERGLGMALGLGSYTIRAPVGPLERTVAWRMIRDVLFESALGVAPLERCRRDRHGQYEPLDNYVGPVMGNSAVSAQRRTEADNLVSRHLNKWDRPAFATAVRNRIEEILNGEQSGEEPTQQRAGGLARAITWLNTLNSTLKQNGEVAVARQVAAFSKQLQEWLTWLTEEVYTQCKQQHTAAQTELDRLRRQSARSWALDEDLEWGVYRLRIRPWNDKPAMNADNEPLMRLAGRFGWVVDYQSGGGWSARLLTPPRDFVWYERADLEPFSTKRKAKDFLDTLYLLAEPLAQSVGGLSALAVATNQDISEWVEKATPRLHVNSTDASKILGQVNKLAILVAPKSAETTALQQRFQSSSEITRIEICETEDATSVTLLRAVDWTPLKTLDLYNDEAWRTRTVTPGLYVWRGEQIATALETDQRLSSRVVSWLASDDELLKLLGLGYLYEVVTDAGRGWEVPGVGLIPGESLYQAIETLLQPNGPNSILKRDRRVKLAALRDAIDKRRDEEASQLAAYLREADAQRVHPLIDSRVVGEQDLGWYLRSVLATEQR